MNAMSRPSRPRDPPSNDRIARHGRCIAAGVSPFACRAGVRPGILYTEEAGEPRSATEKASMSPQEVPRTNVSSRWRSHGESPWRPVVLRLPPCKNCRTNQQTARFARSLLAGKPLVFQQTTRPGPAVTRRKIPLPGRQFSACPSPCLAVSISAKARTAGFHPRQRDRQRRLNRSGYFQPPRWNNSRRSISGTLRLTCCAGSGRC
jgi:hypothetical protein